jgi:hypothetical protein
MNIQNVARSARLYARSEAMVAEILLRAYGRKFAYVSVCILAGMMGLAFLNVAAFIYLQSIWGPVWAPLAIGLLNFAIAAVALLAALNVQPGPEMAVAKELRSAASSNLEDEFQASSSFGGLAGALGGRADTGLANLLLPAVISIVSSISRRKAAAKK